MLPLVPAFVVRSIVQPVYRGLRGDRLLEQLEELERSQWLSRLLKGVLKMVWTLPGELHRTPQEKEAGQ